MLRGLSSRGWGLGSTAESDERGWAGFDRSEIETGQRGTALLVLDQQWQHTTESPKVRHHVLLRDVVDTGQHELASRL